jgi:hypothetical protein
MLSSKKIILFFVTILLCGDISYGGSWEDFLEKENNPENLPYCSNDLKLIEWNDCYKHVEYENGFEYSGVWKFGSFNGKGTIIDDLNNFEYGFFEDGAFAWQWQYDYSKLDGVWNLIGDLSGETIYIYDGWIGIKSIDMVCRILATEPVFIRNNKPNQVGVTDLSFVVFKTNCKDNMFPVSFDNIFIANKGDIVLMQMKVIKPNEGDNPIFDATFPEKYYPGLTATYIDSFEREDVLFFEINRIQDQMTEQDFLQNFGHKFQNN